MRKRNPERDADLGAGAERLAGMAIRFVEIPQLIGPVLQRICGQHPVFVLDDIPDLAGEPRQGDRHAVPIRLGLFAPGRKQAVVLGSDRLGALLDARGKPRLFGDPFPAHLRQRRNVSSDTIRSASRNISLWQLRLSGWRLGKLSRACTSNTAAPTVSASATRWPKPLAPRATYSAISTGWFATRRRSASAASAAGSAAIGAGTLLCEVCGSAMSRASGCSCSQAS